MKKSYLVILLLFISFTVFGQVIKIASVAPEASPWGAGLNKIAAEWSRISNGRVRVTVFHGGIAGSEPDVVRKMRLGQVQGSSVTAVGLGNMLPDIWGMIIPGVIQSADELNYVLEDSAEELDTVFREAGYEILTWSNAGWLQLFSSREIRGPDSIQNIKIGAGGYPEEFLSVLRSIGMQPISTTTSETLSALNSGLLNTVMYLPLGVAGFQWFAVANKMTEFQISPLFGAITIDARAWRRIPEQFHDEFKAVAREIGKEIEAELDALEQEALEQMVNFGLEIISISEEDKNEWQEVFADARLELQDQYFNVPIIQTIQDSVEEFRNQ